MSKYYGRQEREMRRQNEIGALQTWENKFFAAVVKHGIGANICTECFQPDSAHQRPWKSGATIHLRDCEYDLHLGRVAASGNKK